MSIAIHVGVGYACDMHTDAELDYLTDLLGALPFGDDLPMSLGEFDGYVAGLLTCPEMIPPSEWYPGVFGESGNVTLSDVTGVEKLFAALIDHYNRVAAVLATTPEDYLPVYEEDVNEPDVPLWEPWIAGFERAMRLRPDSWVQIVESDDEEAAASVNMILHLVDVHDNTQDHDLDRVEELDRIAPGLLPQLTQSINAWTKSQPQSGFRPPMSDWKAFEPEPVVYGRKVGRNEPCPCGSGRKYKRCCGGI